jgi:hypothetical protein
LVCYQGRSPWHIREFCFSTRRRSILLGFSRPFENR